MLQQPQAVALAASLNLDVAHAVQQLQAVALAVSLNLVAAHVALLAQFLQAVLTATVLSHLKALFLLQLLQLSQLQHQLKMLQHHQLKKLQLLQLLKKLQQPLLQQRKLIGYDDLLDVVFLNYQLSRQVAGMSPFFMRIG